MNEQTFGCLSPAKPPFPIFYLVLLFSFAFQIQQIKIFVESFAVALFHQVDFEDSSSVVKKLVKLLKAILHNQ